MMSVELLGPNNDDRDPENLNVYLKVGFSEVIAEPSALRSIPCSYGLTSNLYKYTLCFSYNFLTLVFGGILSVAYGLLFAAVGFMFVWLVVPVLRFFLIGIASWGIIWRAVVQCFYVPLYDACGLVFSKVRIFVTHSQIQTV